MIGWLDCAAGASGDMFLGALVDAGVPLAELQSSIDLLPVEPVRLTAERVTRHGLVATKVDVVAPPSRHSRRWRDIRELLDRSGLPAEVKTTATEAFERLAAAEGRAHGTGPDEVHFHEVGALDALADIVGTCAGFGWLRHRHDLRTVVASPVAVGGGRTRGAHGAIPIPAPAVLAILSAADAPLTGADLPYEACTPTGAALIATHVTQYGSLPPVRVRTVGTGAGGRDPDEAANVLRLVLGEPVPAATATPTTATPTTAAGTESAVVLECNIDDLDLRLWPNALAAILAAGASDAWLVPILMKKGRSAHTLHVLCRPDLLDPVQSAIFTHTSTIGLRASTVDKYALDRTFSTVEVDGRQLRIKIARYAGEVANVSVEYEDVMATAEALGVPAKIVLARAEAAAQSAYPYGRTPPRSEEHPR